ncbi:hypothetical protein BDY19DRAFT_1026392 [Irpex rosettiformis]|uniref:Uncharacterized protein n=1 Tax=Irpex rosettiformis TaxID=378272 RepID=A0ACB8TQG4_9APHY|nr:hypothetical protein BDY19DRAFT_1026392 [Irpex rosettiformis]
MYTSLYRFRVLYSVKAIPRWPKLAHFANGILTLDFADGKKWEDISKIIIHVAYQVIAPAHCPKGFALLCLIRKWQELDMLLSFSVHTDKTLAAFEATLIRFHHALEAYKAASGDDDTAKDWDGIIKVHSHVHAARDVRMKGVISNMDTKPNEKLNGAIRDAYHRQTNFKNVEPQLAELEDRSMASNTIRAYITACDDSEEAGSYPTESELKSDDDTTRSPMKFGPVYLGSRQRPISILTFVSHGHDDSAFINFIAKLQACVSDLLIREHLDACERDGTLVREMDPIPSVGASDLIHEFRYVEVDFEHKITWRLATDRLRCSPQVYGRPRYDSVVVDWTIGNQENHIVCKLIRVFVYETVNGQKLGLALVQPLNEQVRSRPGDARLGLCRVREKQRQASIVIPIRSVIRGTVIVEDVAHKGEYTVMDMLDTDTYLRMIPMFPDRNMEINI